MSWYMTKSKNGYTLSCLSTAYTRGFAPHPTYFFVLIQKSMQKKSRLRPLRSKNFVCRLKTFKLTRRNTAGSNTKVFFTPAALHFSAHRTRSLRSGQDQQKKNKWFNSSQLCVLCDFFFMHSENIIKVVFSV